MAVGDAVDSGDSAEVGDKALAARCVTTRASTLHTVFKGV
jgi:hypothetical protein